MNRDLETETEAASELINMMHADLDHNADQFLSFFLEGEEYGVDILRVQEIKCWDNATMIPNAPSYVKGVINLRGTIVPVVDLRLRFGLEPVEYTPTTVVIVLKVESADKERTVGFIVDAVSEVYSIENDSLQAPPDMGEAIDKSFVRGLACINEKMVVMLDIDRLAPDQDKADNQLVH